MLFYFLNKTWLYAVLAVDVSIARSEDDCKKCRYFLTQLHSEEKYVYIDYIPKHQRSKRGIEFRHSTRNASKIRRS